MSSVIDDKSFLSTPVEEEAEGISSLELSAIEFSKLVDKLVATAIVVVVVVIAEEFVSADVVRVACPALAPFIPRLDRRLLLPTIATSELLTKGGSEGDGADGGGTEDAVVEEERFEVKDGVVEDEVDATKVGLEVVEGQTGEVERERVSLATGEACKEVVEFGVDCFFPRVVRGPDAARMRGEIN